MQETPAARALRSLSRPFARGDPPAAKIALHVGSGLDKSQNVSPWIDFANEAISDAEFAEARRQFALYQPTSKEEALYLTLLSQCFDLSRVPHLAARPVR